ncbi:MAG: hypothetical protein JXR72_07990 [Proteobacteria bacterium]|nr:hypothetical protein [Pseudomonadota bacterium]
MHENRQNPETPFHVMDCAPVLIATGHRAFSLRELKDSVAKVHPGSLHHHFWGKMLSTAFDEPEFTNDFSGWAFHELHDKTTAERLSVLRPRDFSSIESLRREIIDSLEARLDESEKIHMTVADQPFYFVRSQLVIFNTGRAITSLGELGEAVSEMTLGSIFYHFIEATRRTPEGADDFSTWIRMAPGDHENVCSRVIAIDPYLAPLREIRSLLTGIFHECFGSRPEGGGGEDLDG